MLTQRVLENICLRPAYVIKHSRRKKTMYYDGKLGAVCLPPCNVGKRNMALSASLLYLFASQKHRPL